MARILISSITRKYNSSASYADCGQGIEKSSLKRVPYASNSAEQRGTCAPYNDSAHSSKSKSTEHLKSWVPASEEIKTTLQLAKISIDNVMYIYLLLYIHLFVLVESTAFQEFHQELLRFDCVLCGDGSTHIPIPWAAFVSLGQSSI